ncbi:unnamed protein product, partial [marine sediment metagenome]
YFVGGDKDDWGWGGGLLVELHGSLRLSNCIIRNNSSDRDGGGMCFAGGEDSYIGITDCTITGNSTAISGGGCSCDSGEPIIKNCILWGNTAASGSQIYVYWRRLKISHSDIQDGQAGITIGPSGAMDYGPGNIETDPCFVNPDANDFHLLGASTCINNGDPNFFTTCGTTDIDGEPAILYGRIDIGADEFRSIDGDFEPDGDVDLTDLRILTNSLLNTCNQPYWCGSIDIDRSGSVDMVDFALMAKNWLAVVE